MKRDAYGAALTVRAGERTWTNLVNPGQGFLSSNDPRVHFGLGKVERVDRIEVRWPDGSREWFPASPTDRQLTLTRGQGVRPPS